jgi:DNA-binding NarL/FixJ family response regulator
MNVSAQFQATIGAGRRRSNWCPPISADTKLDVIQLDVDLNGSCLVDILPNLVANGVSKGLLVTRTNHQETLDLTVRRGEQGIIYKRAALAEVLKAIEKVYCG